MCILWVFILITKKIPQFYRIKNLAYIFPYKCKITTTKKTTMASPNFQDAASLNPPPKEKRGLF